MDDIDILLKASSLKALLSFSAGAGQEEERREKREEEGSGSLFFGSIENASWQKSRVLLRLHRPIWREIIIVSSISEEGMVFCLLFCSI